MPEYLAPGVYAEEVSFRQKTIEGVSTSTAGFVGPTRFGPAAGPPPLLTTFLDFERIYGGIDPLTYEGIEVTNHLAHGVRAFFENGGRRLYVSRVFATATSGANQGGVAGAELATAGAASVRLEARHGGSAGNFRVTISIAVGPNILVTDAAGNGVLSGALPFDTILLTDKTATAVSLGSPPGNVEDLHWLEPHFDVDRNLSTFRLHAGAPAPGEPVLLAADLVGHGLSAHVVTVNVTVSGLGRVHRRRVLGRPGAASRAPARAHARVRARADRRAQHHAVRAAGRAHRDRQRPVDRRRAGGRPAGGEPGRGHDHAAHALRAAGRRSAAPAAAARAPADRRPRRRAAARRRVPRPRHRRRQVRAALARGPRRHLDRRRPGLHHGRTRRQPGARPRRHRTR